MTDMKTGSFHNGSKLSREHNNRTEHVSKPQEHIDPSLSHNNEYLIDEPHRKAYDRIFGEAIDEYNAKQNRDDRKKTDYYSEMKNHNKKKVVYEAIAQIGDSKDTGLHDCEKEREVLKEFVEKWSERNPNLELIGAYLHADEPEGTLHMHLDYIPVGKDISRGMKTQNSLTKALSQQGFKTAKGKGSAQEQWQDSERKALRMLGREHGIDIAEPEGKPRKHLDTPEYKELQDQLTEMREEIASTADRFTGLLESVDASQRDLKRINESIVELEPVKANMDELEAMDIVEKGTPFKKDKVLVKKDDFNTIKNMVLTNQESQQRIVDEFSKQLKQEARKQRTLENKLSNSMDTLRKAETQIAKVDALEKENHVLQNQNNELQEENYGLNLNNRRLQKQIGKLKRGINDFVKKWSWKFFKVNPKTEVWQDYKEKFDQMKDVDFDFDKAPKNFPTFGLGDDSMIH